MEHCVTSLILLILAVLNMRGQSNQLGSNRAMNDQQNNYNISIKINKIAQDILAHSSSSNRELLMKSVEKKMSKAAENLGERGKKHVKLIMEGIKLKISDYMKQNKSLSNSVSRQDKHFIFNNMDKDSILGTQLVSNLSQRIEAMIKSEVDKLETTESKQKLIDVIKRRVLESMDEKLNLIEELKPDTAIRRIAVNNDSKNFDFNINLTSDVSQSKSHFIENNMATTSNIETFTITPVCSTITRVCSDIKAMNSLKCIYDEVYVSLDKLCDGNADCPDRSDEKYCGSRVMERMEFSNKVIHNIEKLLAQNCFHIDKAAVARRTHIFRDMLQSQMDYKEKYLNFSSHMNKLAEKKEPESITSINRKSYEIAIIISSLAFALENSFCTQISYDIPMSRRKNIFDTEIDKMVAEVTWPPSCMCKREHCKNCTDASKRICWHMYSLTKWKCDSVNGSGTTFLDTLCDGKVDCIDESDEIGCDSVSAYARFEAQEIYSSILKMLSLKASKERSPIQKKLLYLRNLIVKLQKLTSRPDLDKATIRKLRNKCYSLLKTIYLNKLKQSSIPSEAGEAYTFLTAVNQNLVSALKRSHTGNERVVSNGCHCRNGSCSAPLCSTKCVKSCAVEPKLMNYNCKRNSNKTVSLEKICDGKDDCDNGYDEYNCKYEEICRRHHLIILRNTVQDMGKHLEGTSLGELLSRWKVKVLSTIKVAEKDSRPTPKIFKDVIKNILSDLVTTYGSVKNYRRSNSLYALTDFIRISQSIMETVKTCGK